MTVDPGHRTQALATRDRIQDRSVFSLEMGREGVRLRLAAAGLGDLVALRDLVLRVDQVRYPFDYTAGPRALRRHLMRLERVVVSLRLPALVERARAAGPGGPVDVAGIEGEGDHCVVFGSFDGAAFTLRLRPRPAEGNGDLLVDLVEPRVWAPSRRPWGLVGRLLARLVPEGMGGIDGPGRLRVGLLRRLLGDLLAGMGFKIPLLGRVVLRSSEVAGDEWLMAFEDHAARPGERAASSALQVGPGVEESADPEDAASRLLSALRRGKGTPAAEDAFLSTGIAAPRLWPEVLARAGAAGEERPERVLPHLIAALVAEQDPSLAGPSELALFLGRLARAVEPGTMDAVFAGRLAARLAGRLEPADAVRVLGDLAGVPVAEVFAAAALAHERAGRPPTASALRHRALALAPVGEVAALLSSMAGDLSAAGLGATAVTWLDEVAERAAEGRFGSDGAAIGRQAALLAAAAASSVAGGREGARARLLAILDAAPADAESLALLESISAGGREMAETVSRLKVAAAQGAGEARAGFLVSAARVTMERMGLKRRGVDLLEEALEAAPGSAEAVRLLDRAYGEIGAAEKRLALTESRIRSAGEGESRSDLLRLAIRLAEETGQPQRAVPGLRVLLEADPTDMDALRAGRRVYALVGDRSALREVLESLADLCAGSGEGAECLSELASMDTPAMTAGIPALAGPVAAEDSPQATPPAAPAAVRGPRTAQRSTRHATSRAAKAIEPVSPPPADDTLDRMEAETARLTGMVRTAERCLAAGDAGRALEIATEVVDAEPGHTAALGVAARAARAAGQAERASGLYAVLADRLFSPAEQVAAYLELAAAAADIPDGAVQVSRALARAASISPGEPGILAAAKAFARERLRMDAGADLVARVMTEAAQAAATAGDRGEMKRCSSLAYEAAAFVWDEMGEMDRAEGLLELAVSLDPANEAAATDLRTLSEAMGERGEPTEVK